MSKKKDLLSALNKLKKFFSKDDEVLSASYVIETKIHDIEEEEEEITDESYPLPSEIMKATDFAVFSDGACRGNPGPGSWGVLGQNFEGEVIFEAASFDQETTNNRMELTGAAKALESLIDYAKEIGLSADQISAYLFTDSKYVVDGLNQWRHNWKKKGWKKADNKPVENQTEWEKLDKLTYKFMDFSVSWVKGHANHPQNERCDELCNQILDRELL